MTPPSHDDLDVTHDVDANRFLLRRGEETVGVLAYRSVARPGRQVVDVFSTQIAPEARGHGLGAVLVRAALDDFASQGTAVMASCWYVADFLDANPEYRDVREGHDRPVARQANPDRHTETGEATRSHEQGMSDTVPSTPDGGAPGRPRP